MAYRQHEPDAAFRHLVDAYWVNRPGVVSGAPFDRILPDGCIDLIFRGGDGGGRLFTSALIERPVFFDEAEAGWFVGVRFRPAMARAILDVDPAECRDRDTPAVAIHAGFAALEARLQDCASPEAAFAILKRAVDRRLAENENRAAPMRVQEAVNLLARGDSVRRVARLLGLSGRSLHRDLTRWSGLAPKSLARILRMQRTIAAIRVGRAPLAAIALRMGYADQAHMTRELKELTGFTPLELRPVRNLQDGDAAAA